MFPAVCVLQGLQGTEPPPGSPLPALPGLHLTPFCFLSWGGRRELLWNSVGREWVLGWDRVRMPGALGPGEWPRSDSGGTDLGRTCRVAS